jgi:isoquinoline 1-oxidoreductase subunit beta
MTEHDTTLSRRGFLAGTAGLSFAIGVGGFLGARPSGVLAAAGERTMGAWVTIAPSGAITIAAPAAEMGQGVMTALPMILAEEMDADWDEVTARFAPSDPATFGNPQLGGGMVTVASRAVSGYWTPLRLQGAAVRRFLMQAAADEWGVPVGEVTTEPSAVVHEASGRRLGYGEIAALADQPEALPEVTRPSSRTPPTSASSARRPSGSTSPPRSTAARSSASTCRCPAWSTPPCCAPPRRRPSPPPSAAARRRCPACSRW